jgi:FixJ family two-component response regulator
VIEAIEAGAIYFIVKPFENEKVIEVIKKTIG